MSDKQHDERDDQQREQPARFKPGERVTWNQCAKWAGKWARPAEFIEYQGRQSARIKVGSCYHTVRLGSLVESGGRS